MHELLIYLGISTVAILMFTFWFARQGKVAEKKWLMTQLSSADDSQQKAYITAMQKLKEPQAKFGITTLLVALLIVPATFAIDYLWFHDIPIEQRTISSAENEAMDLATAIKQLEQKLVDNPNDLEGQLLYGRSMMSMQNYPVAVKAYKKANEIKPDDSSILTELAEAIAFQNNTGSFLGEPASYLQQAISIDPNNQKAMWLQGIVFYESQEFELAENIWTDLLAMVDNPNIQSTITKQINQARAALGKPELSATTVSESTAGYFLVIDASEAIKAIEIPANARLFVYAKEVDGMPMPIAAVPIAAPFNWPISVKLTDQQNLNPQRKLSQFEQVEFSAKLSLSGSATPTDDDIFSETIKARNDQSNIHLTLNQ